MYVRGQADFGRAGRAEWEMRAGGTTGSIRWQDAQSLCARRAPDGAGINRCEAMSIWREAIGPFMATTRY